MNLVRPRTVVALQQLVETMFELIVAALQLAIGCQQCPDHALQHGHIRGQIELGNRGSIRHDSLDARAHRTVAPFLQRNEN